MLKRTIALTLILHLLLIGLSLSVSAQEPNRAALVVILEEGTQISRCVEFVEEEINGLELLNRSGLTVETGTTSFGASVCRLEDTGCPGSDCFCKCKGSDCVYWSYWHWRDADWQYSQAGASVYQVKNGAVEGWTWGPGTPQNAPEPPLVTFDEICTNLAAESVIGLEPTAVATPETAATRPITWLSYGVLGLILAGLVGVILVRGRKG